MKLYYTPGYCSLSSHIALREADAPFELCKVDTRAGRTENGGDYKKINPKGYVPALQLDNGEVLTEGPAIMQFVADQNPAAQLAPPAGTLLRARLQEWLNFICSEVHKPFGPLFDSATPEAWRARLTADVQRQFGWLASQLAGRRYLMGEDFTVADGYLFTVLSWAPDVGIPLNPWPTIAQFLARVHARPKVLEALRAEGLVS